ncbi:MAG: SAM-dependent chlorinase/fluorinase [Anaerolineae bacterium]|nr:SAM-dependent chlorinase/fluorinase [Anaerolineae bacterium]
MSRPIVTLTTDFGQADGYAGAMKGIILTICPEAILVDISHEVRPQAVRQAAYVLSTATPYFPAGAVHLVVVDPGVGSDRRPIAVRSERATYVAPDNGVLSLALALDPPQAAVHLRADRPIGATFHGRDLFAPAAARLACGADLDELGEAVSLTGLVSLPNLSPQQQPDGSWIGHILHIDRFGNLISDIEYPVTDAPSTALNSQGVVWVGKVRIAGVIRTYSDVAPGELVAYVGSSGHLEIAVRDGSAAVRLGVGVGDAVRVEGLL